MVMVMVMVMVVQQWLILGARCVAMARSAAQRTS
jgi:hypothetical protein